MLLQTLDSFSYAPTITKNEKDNLKQSAIRYSLNLTNLKSLNDSARKCGVFEDIKDFKKNFLRGNEYVLSNFWKAIVSCVGEKNCNKCVDYKYCNSVGFVPNCNKYKVSVSKVSKEFNVGKEDVKFALMTLTREERGTLLEKYEKRLKDGLNSSIDKDRVFKNLYSWCHKLVHDNFRFILKYNWDLEPKDLVQQFLLEGYIRALECDTMTDEKYFINTIKQRISKRSINIIGYYTAAVRSRLVEDKDAGKTLINSMADKLNMGFLSDEEKEKRFGKLIDKQFSVQHLSLDYNYENQNDENDDKTMGDIFPAIRDESVEETDLINNVLKEIKNDHIKRAMKIITGHHDSEYLKFIKMEQMNHCTKSVLKFLKISKKEFLKVIKKALLVNDVTDEDTFELLTKNIH